MAHRTGGEVELFRGFAEARITGRGLENRSKLSGGRWNAMPSTGRRTRIIGSLASDAIHLAAVGPVFGRPITPSRPRGAGAPTTRRSSTARTSRTRGYPKRRQRERNSAADADNSVARTRTASKPAPGSAARSTARSARPTAMAITAASARRSADIHHAGDVVERATGRRGFALERAALQGAEQQHINQDRNRARNGEPVLAPVPAQHDVERHGGKGDRGADDGRQRSAAQRIEPAADHALAAQPRARGRDRRARRRSPCVGDGEAVANMPQIGYAASNPASVRLLAPQGRKQHQPHAPHSTP